MSRVHECTEATLGYFFLATQKEVTRYQAKQKVKKKGYFVPCSDS